MIAVRGGAGLGDSLYVQAIARHLVKQGQRIEVCSAWPDVFRPLGDRAKVSAFRRTEIDRLAHYSLRRDKMETDQFQDCCLQAGIHEPVDLRLDWQVRDGLAAYLRSPRRPVIAVPLPRAPMDRKDGFGAELMPRFDALQAAIDAIRRRGALVVQIGAGKGLHAFRNIDIDLANRTSVCDLLDVANSVDGFLGHVSFMVPLAASLKKPALFVWSRAGLNSPNQLIRWLTPHKVIHGAGLRPVIDDEGDAAIAEAADALCEQARCPLAA